MTSTLSHEPVNLASSLSDAEAAETVVAHHARMSGQLRALVDTTLAAVSRDGEVQAAKAAVLKYAREELLPHARAEENTIYAAAANDPSLSVLVEAMITEHAALLDVVNQLDEANTAGEVAAATGALWTLFTVHLTKENDLIVPRLAATSTVSLADLIHGLHELTGATDSHEGRGGCNCGHEDDSVTPVLDVRAIPHAIRHATVFGALEVVPVGGGLILMAPHDPIPLLNQIKDRHQGAFTAIYREEGPETWQVELRRNS